LGRHNLDPEDAYGGRRPRHLGLVLASTAVLLVVEAAGKTARLATEIGLPWALTVTLGLFGIPSIVCGSIVVRGRRAERRRRRHGEPPSWWAHPSTATLTECGATLPPRYYRGRNGRLTDPETPLLGRLSYLGNGFRWEPNGTLRKSGVPPVTWDDSWSPSVTPLRGMGHQGRLMLHGADGAKVTMRIWNSDDFQRVVHPG
jgi:hypothetical protein